jgi:ribosomal protein L32
MGILGYIMRLSQKTNTLPPPKKKRKTGSFKFAHTILEKPVE